MPVSINALFNVPTRDEKERKRSQAQATVDDISKMNLADEITKGQMRMAKELGLEFDEKQLDALTKRNIEALKTAGADEPTAKKEEATARTEPIKKAANLALKWMSGGALGLPQKEAKRDADMADADSVIANNRRMREEGASELQGTLGRLSSQGDVADAKLRKTKSVLGIDSATDEALTADAIRKQTRAAAEDYIARGALRELQVGNDITKGNLERGYLNMIGGDPLRQEAMFNRIPLEAYGIGANNMTPMRTLNVPEGSRGALSQGGQGMSLAPETPQQTRQRILESLKSSGGGIRLQD